MIVRDDVYNNYIFIFKEIQFYPRNNLFRWFLLSAQRELWGKKINQCGIRKAFVTFGVGGRRADVINLQEILAARSAIIPSMFAHRNPRKRIRRSPLTKYESLDSLARPSVSLSTVYCRVFQVHPN